MCFLCFLRFLCPSPDTFWIHHKLCLCVYTAWKEKLLDAGCGCWMSVPGKHGYAVLPELVYCGIYVYKFKGKTVFF